jgi:hypothetical protein
MILLKDHHAILENSAGLTPEVASFKRGQLEAIEKLLRGVKKADDKLQTRIGSQIDPVALVLRS